MKREARIGSLVLAAALVGVFLLAYFAPGPPPAKAQVLGPPAPDPSALTAQARTEILMEDTCRKINKVIAVTLPRSPVPVFMKIGKCKVSDVSAPLEECFLERGPVDPATGKQSRSDRWSCIGHIGYTAYGAAAFTYKTPMAPPCMNAYIDWGLLNPAPLKTHVAAQRTIHVFRKKDGLVGHRQFPWTCYDWRKA